MPFAIQISTPQNTALAVTGIIWSRYATQITPVNYNLLSVNIFVAATGLYQLARKHLGIEYAFLCSAFSGNLLQIFETHTNISNFFKAFSRLKPPLNEEIQVLTAMY